MNGILKVALALVLPMSALAQTTGTAVFRGGHAVVDTAGNLIVFDEGRSTTGVTITGLRHSFYAPVTRLTVQRPGSTGNIQTVSYDSVGELWIDPSARIAAIGEKTLVLTPVEFQILALLARSVGRVKTPEQLLLEAADRDFEGLRSID